MPYRPIESDHAVILDPPRATASVIWLHGLGADGHDFVPIVPELALDALAIRFVFPHAPVRPVTLNNGYRMPAWYDIESLTERGRGDAVGMAQSVATVEQLIATERAGGIPGTRIVLAGFSQGGAVALHAGLSHALPLAGILAASTYLPLADELEPRLPAQRDLPVLMCHGSADGVVAPALGRRARDWLAGHGYAVDWREYPMAHEVCAAEIRDVSRWLAARLG